MEQLATLRQENTALRAQNAALQDRIRELEARLGQNSSNSWRSPSSDPPQASRKRPVVPSGRKGGGQPGHRGAFRALLPVEQVDEVVAVAPQVCQHCGRPFPETPARRARVWQHQVMELLPLAVRVTEYQMVVRRCPACGKRTRADLPAGVPRRPFGARLTAVIALLSGRYRLSRREVRQLLQDLWAVRVSLGAERALRPVVLWRKGCFGSDSEAGSRFVERLLTVVATCRQQGRSLLDFLVAAGEAALRRSPPPSLLPVQRGS